MTKIFHVITTIERGGAENHLIDLVRTQVSSGSYEVAVAYLRGSPYWLDEFTRIGVEVIDLRMYSYGDPVPVIRLAKAIKKIKPDLIHSHLAPGELYTRLALVGSSKVGFITSRHNEYTFTRNRFEEILGKFVISRLDGCICISKSVMDVYSQIPSYQSVKFWKIHYGRLFRGQENGQSDERSTIPCTSYVPEKTILMNSRLIPQKRVDIAIRVFSMFLSFGSYENWQLKIIGTGDLEDSLKNLVQSLDLTEKVKFLGFVENIDELNYNSDIFLHTPDKEGFGLVLLEAMNAGLPIVATKVSAIPEIVNDGSTGFLHRIDDYEGMANSLKALADSIELCNKMGSSGRSRLKSYFNLSRQYLETSAAYSELLKLEEPDNIG